MNQTIIQEFYRWVRTLNASNMTAIERKILNVIMLNFDALIPLGTAGGTRARKLISLINENPMDNSEVLLIPNEADSQNTDRIRHISELEIGPFRGFATPEKFSFEKKYTFLYGPNGSGKSSFCEGLEYALLGYVEEAAAKRIPVAEYIKNTITKSAVLPVAYQKDAAKNRIPISQNSAIYRFAFIEKNRIEDFARITAAAPSDQKSRIATLFGLDAFSEFVNGFTDNFQQYLQIDTPKAIAFANKNLGHERNKSRLEEIENLLNSNLKNLKILLEEVGEKEVNSEETLRHFLNGDDGVSGKINELQATKAQQIPDDITMEVFDSVFATLPTIKTLVTGLEAKIKKLADLSSDVNYKELYSAILSVSDMETSDKTVCPACKTSISETVLNPFTNAKVELDKLKDLSILQTEIPDIARKIEREVRKLITETQLANQRLKEVNYTGLPIEILSEVIYTDIGTISTWVGKISKEIITATLTEDSKALIKSTIQTHNEGLAKERKNREKIDAEIRKFQSYNNRLVQLVSEEQQLKKELAQVNISLESFLSTNAQELEEIAAEALLTENNKELISAYNGLIAALKTYRNGLPALLATGLSDRVKEYYNLINAHDPDFERLDSIQLATVAGEKILIKFSGSVLSIVFALQKLNIRHSPFL